MAEFKLRPYQEKVVEEAREAVRSGHKSLLVFIPTGGGKCWAPGTEILMYDGSIKAVEDVVVGDKVMGPDSKPRHVKAVTNGHAPMYRITPVKGNPFTVSEQHILPLKLTGGAVGNYPEHVNVSVAEYLTWSKYRKHIYKLWRVGDEKRKNVTGIKSVEYVGIGEYYGFVVDGDGLIVRGDFTVDHNTAIASQMMHNAFKAGYRSIVLAHRRELVIQTAERFRQYGIEPTILMDGFEFDPSANLVVASQQTWDSRRQWIDGEYRLAIFDEAHIGVNRQRRIMEDIGAVSPDAIFVGLTATPMTNSGPGLGSIYSYLVHGPTLSELTEQGYLVPAEHYVMQPIDFNPVESIKIKGGEYDEENVFEWFTRNAILGDVITNWEDNFYGKRTIVFARSVKQSVYIARGFGDRGIPFAHIDYRTPEKDRRRIIDGFRNGDIVGITSVDIVSEGFDVPDVEVAILATPIHTVTRYIQRVGRVLRPAPGKEKAYIVDHSGVLNEHGTIYNFQEWALEPERPDRFVPYHALKGLKADWKRKCPTCGHEFKPGPKVCPRCGYDFYVLPPGYEPPIIPATMVEYENAKKYEREGRRKKCRGMNLPFYHSPQSVYDWLRHLAVLREWKLGFADVLFYSATCSCPHELHLIRYQPEQLLKMYGDEPHEVAIKIMKRYWVLKNRGYFKTFKCWD